MYNSQCQRKLLDQKLNTPYREASRQGKWSIWNSQLHYRLKMVHGQQLSLDNLLTKNALKAHCEGGEYQVRDERRAIRNRLGDNRLTFVWLIDQLHLRGIVTDKTELSSVFAGTRNGPKAESIVATSAQILDEYESKFAAKTAT